MSPAGAWPGLPPACGAVGRPSGLTRPPLAGLTETTPARLLRVAAGGLIASAKYRPGFYPGELTLFVPARRDPGLPSLAAVWRGHARALSTVAIAGEHTTMLAAPTRTARPRP